MQNLKHKSNGSKTKQNPFSHRKDVLGITNSTMACWFGVTVGEGDHLASWKEMERKLKSMEGFGDEGKKN